MTSNVADPLNRLERLLDATSALVTRDRWYNGGREEFDERAARVEALYIVSKVLRREMTMDEAQEIAVGAARGRYGAAFVEAFEAALNVADPPC